MAKGSSGNNNKALKLQRQSMQESKRQAKAMEKLMKQSAQAAEAPGMVIPPYEPPAAQPTQTTADLEATAMDARKRAMRRQGLNATTFAGNTAYRPAA